MMYNDNGYGKYGINNIINCHAVTWEEYCNAKDLYSKMYYDIEPTIDFLKNGSADICVNGKRYNAKGNILTIRKDNMFSQMNRETVYEKWYMISMLSDIVKKVDSDYAEVMEKLFAFAEEKPVVVISDENAFVLADMFSSLNRTSVELRDERGLKNREILRFIIDCFEIGEPIEGCEYRFEMDEIYKVIDYIKSNIASKLSVDEIADACYFDKYYLSKIFKKYTDHTINQFVTVYRVRRSIEYLYEGYSVEEAGKMCGFKNADTYIKAFKQIHYNITPKQFIKRGI